MSGVIITIIFLGIIIGVITFFLIKSIILPKKIATIEELIKQGKINSAVRTAKHIISKDPRNFEAHYLLGKAYLADNKPDLALIEFKTVNNIGVFGGYCPEEEFRQKIASLYEKFGQIEEALKEFLLLIKLNPENAEYYYKTGELFEKRNKSEKATNYYRKTIELDPNYSMAHYKLGVLLYRGKKTVEAKAELERAIKEQPDNYKAYFYLGKLLKENHDYVGALHAFEKAQKDQEQKVKALIERGGCYMSMNSIDSAISELERALKISKDDKATETLYGRYFLGLCYEKVKNIDKAMENWEKIYTVRPKFKDVAEKISQYQELRTDDRVKDYLTASMDNFYEICKSIVNTMNMNVRDITDVPNGCQFIAVIIC